MYKLYRFFVSNFHVPHGDQPQGSIAIFLIPINRKEGNIYIYIYVVEFLINLKSSPRLTIKTSYKTI